MKAKSLLITLLLISVIGSVWAQRPGFVHKPFSQYRGDTLTYLKDNFSPGIGPYLDRPFSELLDNLEIEVKAAYYKAYSGKVGLIALVFTDKEIYKRNLENHVGQIQMFIAPADSEPTQAYRTIFNAEPDQIVDITPMILKFLRSKRISPSTLGTVNVFRM